MNQDIPSENSDVHAGLQMTLAAIVISVFLGLGKIMGYVKEILLAKYFGVSGVTDAFKIPYNVIVFGLYTKIEKLLRPTYLPEFVRMKQEDGDEQAWRITSVLSSLQLLVLIGLGGLVMIFAEPLVRYVWPGLASNPEHLELAVVILRIMAPALVLFSLSVMPELTLHSYKRFTLPAVAETCYRTAIVLTMIALIGWVWAPTDPRAIYAAALGVLAGGACRLFVQLPALKSKLRHFRFSLAVRGTPGLVGIFWLMPPVVLGLVFSWARTFGDSICANSLGAGMYTALDFGRKLSDLAILILPLAVSFVVYPYLSEWAARDEKDRLADALVSMTRAMAFIFIPLSVAIVILARPFSSLVYELGKTGPEDIALISLALRCYAVGIFFYAVEGSINKWYFALKDTGTPNYVGASMVVVHLVIAYGGGLKLGWGLAAVALALTISKSTKVIILYGLLLRRIGKIDANRVYPFVLKLVASTALMGVVVYMVGQQMELVLVAWQPPLGGAKLRVLVLFATAGLAGTATFLGMAALTRIEELFLVAHYLTEKIRGRLACSH